MPTPKLGKAQTLWHANCRGFYQLMFSLPRFLWGSLNRWDHDEICRWLVREQKHEMPDTGRYSTQAIKPCRARHLDMEIRRARPDKGPDLNNRCNCCTRTSLEPSWVQSWGLRNTGWQVWRLGEINLQAAASTQDFLKEWRKKEDKNRIGKAI